MNAVGLEVYRSTNDVPRYAVLRELRQIAETALANASPGESLTLPAANGWYEVPLVSAPNLFKSLSPTNTPTWVTPSTQVIGQAADTGRRFIVDLEAGKETLHAGKLLKVLETLGFGISLVPPEGA